MFINVSDTCEDIHNYIGLIVLKNTVVKIAYTRGDTRAREFFSLTERNIYQLYSLVQ